MPTEPPAQLPFDESTLLRVFDVLDQRYFDQETGAWADSHPYGTCTYVNALPIATLNQAGHSCQMFGKSEEAFDGQPWHTEYEALTGHDWLVVDDRWVVDLWIKPYVNIDRAVFDLQKEDDRKIVNHIYGPREEWELAEARHVEARQMHPEIFPEVLDEARCGKGVAEESIAMHRLPCPEEPVRSKPKDVGHPSLG